MVAVRAYGRDPIANAARARVLTQRLSAALSIRGGPPASSSVQSVWLPESGRFLSSSGRRRAPERFGDIWNAADRGAELPIEPQRRCGRNRVCICTRSILSAPREPRLRRRQARLGSTRERLLPRPDAPPRRTPASRRRPPPRAPPSRLCCRRGAFVLIQDIGESDSDALCARGARL